MRVIAVVGPTAVGKTSLSIALALRLGGEIISADSRQVYTGLDLGTGKVTLAETQGVPHHLIDICDPRTQFTVHDFVTLGQRTVEEIDARGNVPIVVGGTGLYVDTLLGRVTLDAPEADAAMRESLSHLSLAELQKKLTDLDPERATSVDMQNPRRVARAIEIALGGPRKVVEQKGYDVTWIGLTLDRERLKERIHTRLLERLHAGMLDEAQKLHTTGLTYERMEALGLEYRYLARHLEGKISYDEMLATLDAEIFKYAKRQMTWFKRNTAITWLEADAPTLQEQALALWS